MNRFLRIENLETRIALDASGGLVFLTPTDVNNDGYTTPLDALLVINAIGTEPDECSRLDVDFNGTIGPQDALAVINNLNKFEDVREELTESQMLWDGQDVGSYEMTYEVRRFGPLQEFHVVVENGEVVSATDLNGSDVALDSVETVDSLFEQIDNAILTPVATLSVEFDGETGRPTRVYINPLEFISDLDSTILVTEFRIR